MRGIAATFPAFPLNRIYRSRPAQESPVSRRSARPSRHPAARRGRLRRASPPPKQAASTRRETQAAWRWLLSSRVLVCSDPSPVDRGSRLGVCRAVDPNGGQTARPDRSSRAMSPWRPCGRRRSARPHRPTRLRPATTRCPLAFAAHVPPTPSSSRGAPARPRIDARTRAPTRSSLRRSRVDCVRRPTVRSSPRLTRPRADTADAR